MDYYICSVGIILLIGHFSLAVILKNLKKAGVIFSTNACYNKKQKLFVKDQNQIKLSMKPQVKNSIEYAIAIACILGVSKMYAQKNTTVSVNNDSVKFRNEISINVGPLSSYTSTLIPIPAVSIGYSHNFSKNNFLRTGIKLSTFIKEYDDSDRLMGGNNYLGDFAPQPTTNTYDTLAIGLNNEQTIRGSVYAGYEHLFGKRKVKFLLGIDVYVGFTNYTASQFTENYEAYYSIDSTQNNAYNTSLTFINETITGVTALGFHIGFSPRIGLRYDPTPRIAFTAIMAPLMYVDLNTYLKTQVINSPSLNIIATPFATELGFIVKL